MFVTPTWRPISAPPLKTTTVGAPRMPSLAVTAGDSSMSSLPTLIVPTFSSAIRSTIGASMRQGPHHVAVKSRRNGRNAARNFRRKHRRLTHADAIEPTNEPAGSAPNAEELLANAEDVVRLRACVAELCTVQRAVVMLRLLEERSGEDAAETLGLARGHVDVLVHRAKAALKVCMRHSEARATSPAPSRG